MNCTIMNQSSKCEIVRLSFCFLYMLVWKRNSWHYSINMGSQHWKKTHVWFRWIKKYADDQDIFFEDFKNAYIKLVNSGARWKSLWYLLKSFLFFSFHWILVVYSGKESPFIKVVISTAFILNEKIWEPHFLEQDYPDVHWTHLYNFVCHHYIYFYSGKNQ